MDIFLIKLLIPFASLVSFFIVFATIPTIIKVTRSKGMFADSNGRTLHKTAIPNLGGIAIFMSFLFTYSIFSDWFSFTKIPFLIPSILIIFAIGIKDDIMITAPIVKLMGQICAAFIIVAWGDVRITSFHGFFGIEPDYLTSITFSIFLFVFIINGFNLIDGIDGLASTVAIISITSFMVWFYINDDYHIPVFSAVLIGVLLAFMYYNVFSKTNKIFMGDTGSLILGFLIVIAAIRFCEFNIPENRHNLKYTMDSAPAVAIGILIVPIIDTIRVFIFRLSRGNSPFTADKNHIHHRMLTLGFTHLQTSLIIGGVNIVFVILSYALKDLGVLKLSLLIFTLGLGCSYIPAIFILRRKKKIKYIAAEYRRENIDDK